MQAWNSMQMSSIYILYVLNILSTDQHVFWEKETKWNKPILKSKLNVKM